MRWPTVIAAMAATLAVLFGAGFVLKSQTVEEPLKALYAQSPAVESYTFDKQSDAYAITVRLKDVPDLAPAYKKLYDDTGKLLKDTTFTIEVEDHRSPELEQAYRRVNLYVQEALATGQFSGMADRIETEATKDGMTARMEVDNDRVFVDMHKGDAYLYSVVNRTAAVQPKSQNTGGGTGL
jgi:hypothetical protein